MDLITNNQKIAINFLIIFPLLIFLVALPNNIFSFMTFRRQKSLCNGIGHYLLSMSVINQINIGLLVARLIHLSVIATNQQSLPVVDNVLCKMLNYLLTCSTRISYWFTAFVAIERVCSVIFLQGYRFKKPCVARYLMILTSITVLLLGGYELFFVKSFSNTNDDRRTMCVIEFPVAHRSMWMFTHQIVSIMNYILPLLINICCMITISCIVIKTKMNIRERRNGKLLL
jgi:hypothetical protein